MIIAIIAITHEFAHGIFAAHNNVKTKSTGFGFFPFFLPIFLAAFVELDEKTMAKKSKFSQLAILSAGTFANVLTAILFFGVIWIFFSLAFAPSGVMFDTYPYTVVEVSSITMVNGVALNNPTYKKVVESLNDYDAPEGFNKIKVNEQDYIAKKSFLERQKGNEKNLFLYYEDVDISWRIHMLKRKILFIQNAIVHHDVGHKNKEMTFQKFSYIVQNRLYVCQKNFSSKNLLTKIPIIVLLLFFTSVYYNFKFKSIKYTLKFLKAYFWNVRHIKTIFSQR
ncbi:MAG: site-2 protease family protein [Thaumarchaeota archaeon]|nr:site-2 protease family protein [Nitrososphaerota archaeon]